MSYSNKSILLTIALTVLCLSQHSLAQKGVLKKANKHYDNFNFAKASELYRKAWDKDPKSIEAKSKLADCYRLMNDIEQAELYYSYVVKDEAAEPVDDWHYAQTLRSNQKYDEAQSVYEAYAEANPEDERAQYIAEGMDVIKELAVENPTYVIDLLSINTKSSEFSPAFYKDGIVFASNRNRSAVIKWLDLRTQNNFLDLYNSQKDENGEMQKAELFEGRQPNRRYHEGPVAFNKNETEVYITRSNYTKNKEEKSDNETVHLKIYKLDTDAAADNLENLTEAVPFNSKEYSVGHPALSADNQYMYFMSNMPGGYGGTDLYVSQIQGKVWSDPENLGPEINTSGNEMFPFMDAEGILYFASDGDVGLGGLDIYHTKKQDGVWTAVQNIGAPINSSKDDFGLIYDPVAKEGYFASNRDGGQGDDDIYHFVKKGITIKGEVYDVKTGRPVPGALVQLDEGATEKVADESGQFEFVLEPNVKYDFLASKADYFPGELSVDVDLQPLVVKIPIRKDEGIALEVSLRDKKTKEKLDGAEVVLRNTVTGKEEKGQTNAEGICSFLLDEGVAYEVTGWKNLPDPNQKYLKVNTAIDTKGKTSGAKLYAVLDLEFVEKGVAIKIDNIYYDLNQYLIRMDAAAELDKIAKIMKDNPSMEIELSSHTDSRGSDTYNKTLSEKRARTAVEYITSLGVAPQRITAAGYGEIKLVNGCSNGVKCENEEHQKNRRTEFKILKF